MSNSKPVSPFVFDVLCYLNRDQLERFSIVCRSLKNIIERYFCTKPYRTFDRLFIRGGYYALFHNGVRWHPNRDDYTVQQFLDGQKCSQELKNCYWSQYYSFAEMRPYLGTNIRVFSSAAVPNEFKILFRQYMISCRKMTLNEFRGTNNASGEKLELKKGVPIEYRHRISPFYEYYTLERSKI
ncbi:hypothetical protein DdX_21604 [Ditylenchus destructor]|uniref:F-box domain-containing protein n=1 Tax=Ditylenchus destructor TaxID=166010 RepID=A0AAD4QSZ3_9BILA|nr:hypothetical protein DdX_21604 [Ditylenchus destructor]